MGCQFNRTPPPPLPTVSLDRFSPAIRQAIETALAQAQAKPNDAAACGRLGMVLQAHDQFRTAQQAYSRASQLDPADASWPYYEGTVLAAEGEHTRAIPRFERCLELDRADTAARRRLADSLIAAGRNQDAAAEYRRLLESLPADPLALFGLGRATQQPALYEQAVARDPQFGAAIFALAQHYQRTGRLAEAARLMDSYPRYKTQSPPVTDPRADAVAALNRGPSQLLRQAIQLETAGRLAEAAQLNEQALALDPQLTQAHINLLSAYARLGDTLRAETHYRAAIAQNPNASEAHYNFGVLCLEQNRVREATAAFEAAIRIDSDHALSLANLGAIRASAGDLDGAAKRLRQALAVQPDLRMARFQLGRILANQRQYPAAIEQFEQAVQVEDAATPGYLYALGATQARAGQLASAARTLERARALGGRMGQADLTAAIERDLARLKR